MLDNVISFLSGCVLATIMLLFLMVIPGWKYLSKKNRMLNIELKHASKEQKAKDDERRAREYEKEQCRRVDQF